MADRYVTADPYPWPFNGDLRQENTALIVIDMQTDFCGFGGYVDRMGYDLSLTRAAISPLRPCWTQCAAMASTSFIPARATARTSPTCREQALAFAADRRRHRRSRTVRSHSRPRRARLGDHLRARSAPRRADHRQARQGLLLCHGSRVDAAASRHLILILTGITTDVCVHTTMREANDRGFECLILEDCSGATDRSNHEHAIKMVKMQGGVFGAVAASASLLALFARLNQLLLATGSSPQWRSVLEHSPKKRDGIQQKVGLLSPLASRPWWHVLCSFSHKTMHVQCMRGNPRPEQCGRHEQDEQPRKPPG